MHVSVFCHTSELQNCSGSPGKILVLSHRLWVFWFHALSVGSIHSRTFGDLFLQPDHIASECVSQSKESLFLLDLLQRGLELPPCVIYDQSSQNTSFILLWRPHKIIWRWSDCSVSFLNSTVPWTLVKPDEKSLCELNTAETNINKTERQEVTMKKKNKSSFWQRGQN